MDINQLSVNVDKEEQGVVIDLGNGAWIKVASVNKRSFIEAMQEAYKPYRVQFDTDTITEDKAFELRATCMARHLILDWGGFTENGEPVDFSVETAQRWMLDRSKKPFHELVWKQANNVQNFQDVYENKALGN